MVAQVHVLHPTSPPIAAFLRVGHTGHRKLEALLASNRLPIRRMVFDAGHIHEQVELVKALKARGYETVLDPNSAEMATLGRFASSIGNLPWGNPDRPWQPEDFSKTRNLDTAKAVAEFAIKYEVDAVLAPTHFIESVPSLWTNVDLKACEQLRRELDQSGGKDVAIDYQLIATNTLLKDQAACAALVSDLPGLPIENIWLRASGFGATSTGAATRSFIESVRRFHDLKRPLIADYAGGYSGLAAASFGAVGGICHGVAQKEKFKASEWQRPATGGGGSAKRIYVPELDRSFKEEELDALFEAKGGRARFGCNDSTCCQHGIEDMIEKPHVHFITQRSRQIESLSSVPEARRADHFLLQHLDVAIRSARYGARLKVPDDKVSKAIREAKKRMVLLRDSLGDLQSGASGAARSRALRFRGRAQNSNRAVG
jgi:hypothetical protein